MADPQSRDRSKFPGLERSRQKIIARVTRREPSFKSKMQQILNDILLALCARRLGADLYTFNRDDFDLIRRHRPFSLKVLKW
jgi:predicted nucleic acid-binding protein